MDILNSIFNSQELCVIYNSLVLRRKRCQSVIDHTNDDKIKKIYSDTVIELSSIISKMDDLLDIRL